MRQSRETISKRVLLHSAPAPGHCAVEAGPRAAVRKTQEPAPSIEEVNRMIADLGRRIEAMRKPTE
jgi:hypothetical protein